MHPWIRTVLGVFFVLWAAGPGSAQTRPAAATQPARQAAGADENDVHKLLGDRFTSQAAGISFRVPAGGQQVKRLGVGADLIVTYANADEQWTLKCSRIFYSKPMKLVSWAPAPGENAEPKAAAEPGVLDAFAASMQANIRGAEQLRKDVINVGSSDTGLLINRYTRGPQTWLHQSAIIQANDQLYYILDFETPSGHTAADKAAAGDPAEQLAFELFQAILDSTVLIDQTAIKHETESRIYASLAAKVNMAAHAREKLLPEQYFRILRNGKDVGFLAQYEEWGSRRDKKGNPTDGLIVATLMEQAFAETGTRLTVASEMFNVPDLRTADELWVTISIANHNGVKDHVTEWGQVYKDIRAVVLDGEHENQARRRVPNATVTDEYRLRVTTAGSKDPARTTSRDLPPWYLPEAQAAMLPRLLPYREPKNYVFLTWVSSEQQLIMRFVDVEPAQQVKFNGKVLEAVIIKDRVSFEGQPTFHYVTLNGEYLGSYTPSTGVTLAVSDLATLQKLNPGAKIHRPFADIGERPEQPEAPEQDKN